MTKKRELTAAVQKKKILKTRNGKQYWAKYPTYDKANAFFTARTPALNGNYLRVGTREKKV
jgi:hypothetical protein